MNNAISHKILRLSFNRTTEHGSLLFGGNDTSPSSDKTQLKMKVENRIMLNTNLWSFTLNAISFSQDGKIPSVVGDDG